MFSKQTDQKPIKKYRNLRNFGTMVSLLIVLVCSICYIGFLTFSNYRNTLIDLEENVLLSMARSVGESLVSYVSEELETLDFFFSSWEKSGVTSHIDPSASVFSSLSSMEELDPDLYEGVTLYDADGTTLYSSGSTFQGDSIMEKYPDWETTFQHSRICGKEFLEEGRYQMYVAHTLYLDQHPYLVVFSLNLSTIHREIVSKIKIGHGGYSVIKDKDLAIIMHHAKNQIGMDAIYDRAERYPELDLTSLIDWIEMQKTQPEGYSVIDSYMWDDDAHPEQKRLVAYTTIELPGDTWIVNSTLPYEELDEPLVNMMIQVIFICLVFTVIMVLIFFYFARMLMKADIDQKEIQYLRQINDGMKLLRQKEEEVQHYQRVQSLGQMSSHIAHEFNNYLTPIMVYGELLETDPDISEENKDMVRGILDVSKQAADLSRKLLDFSRQDSGSTVKPINLTEQLEKSVHILKQLTPARVTLDAQIPDEPIYIMGRDAMMENVLMNLGNNAFHAMEQNTDRKQYLTIRLLTEASADGEISRTYSSMAVLEVTDTGCGIPKDAMDKLFEPFFTTKRSGKGTGLGLSVVNNLVTGCGGNIQVKSEVQKGTTFRLCFPRVEAAVAASPVKNLNPIHHITFVDDDPEMRKSVRKYLEEKGYSCRIYDHPAAVLGLLQNNQLRTDLIITDYSMSAMNGLEFAEIVKKLAPDLPIILTSGMEDVRFEWYLKNRIIDRFVLKTELFRIIPDSKDATCDNFLS